MDMGNKVPIVWKLSAIYVYKLCGLSVYYDNNGTYTKTLAKMR